jgi:hypothetical protein
MVMQSEAEVVELCLYDRRIGALVRSCFRNSFLADYLIESLREVRGSLEVAKLIVGALQKHLHLPKDGLTVSREDVSRLCVHNGDEEVLERLSHAIKEVVPDYVRDSRDLAMHFEHDFGDIQPGTPLQGITFQHRAGVSQIPNDIRLYLRVFLCAVAICKGIAVDPRQPLRAVRVSTGG